jgi:hypothetical protein
MWSVGSRTTGLCKTSRPFAARSGYITVAHGQTATSAGQRCFTDPIPTVAVATGNLNMVITDTLNDTEGGIFL